MRFADDHPVGLEKRYGTKNVLADWIRGRVCLCLLGLEADGWGWKLTARSAYEAAEYDTLERDGQFEIREYPKLMLATTSMKVASQGEDGSFMRFFRYISGGNDVEQKVAMTVPVFMEENEEFGPGQMGLVLPKDVSSTRIPKPADLSVNIRQRDGGKFAVFRFPGRMNQTTLDDAEQKLRRWIESKGYLGEPHAEYAGYDPPGPPACCVATK